MLWDKKTDKHVYNAIVYPYRRTTQICKNYMDLSARLQQHVDLSAHFHFVIDVYAILQFVYGFVCKLTNIIVVLLTTQTI